MSEDIFENIDSPNSSAYEKMELREGIPLSYVSEKLAQNLIIVHNTYRLIKENISDDLKLINPVYDDLYSPKTDGLLSPLYSAFRYGVTAFLALHNVLGIANNQGIFERLLTYSREDFKLWVNRIESEGSING